MYLCIYKQISKSNNVYYIDIYRERERASIMDGALEL